MNRNFKGLAHIGIMTNDLDRSLDFYRILGGTVKDTAVLPTPQGEKKLVMVDVCGLTVELIVPPVPSDAPTGVISHFAVWARDLDAVGATLRAAGYDAFDTPTKNTAPIFGGVTNWFLTGPNGERIELMEKKD